MQAGNIGWAGQAFAVASSNDSGGKKSRIRRSKEERKSMVESFIKKYQESNNGNFPSLNLAHKEVGGSFYTVREIVREIIQENRVLAPPRVSLEEHGLSGFLEQHPLGSISMEPIIDLSVSDRGDVITHIAPNEIQFSSAVNISPSSESHPLELNNEQTVSGEDGASDRTSESYHRPNHFQDKSMEEVSNSPQSKSHKFEESIVNGFVVVDGSPLSDKPLITSADHHGDIDEEPGSQMLNNDQYHLKDEQTIDKDKEFGQRFHTVPTAIETLDQEKLEAQHIESSPSIKSHTNSGVVVETFPLRPVPRTINNMAEESGKLHDAAETSEDEGIEQEPKTTTQNYSSLVSEKSDKKLPHSTVELNGKNCDAKVVLNPQGPSSENAKHPSFKPSVLDAGDIGELESKGSLPDGAKVSSSTKTSISEDSTTVGGKSSDQDNSSEAKGNNPTLDRINLETWDRAAKKSQPESNPLLALVKAMISSFVKFFTEE